MIDIHAHILPQVDDGPSDWEETIAMIQHGIADGVTGVVCTSHVMNQLDAQTETLFQERFDTLRQRVKKENLNIALWLGSEIHIAATFDVRSKIATLNGNGKYILMELPMSDIPRGAADTFFELSLGGVTPILAHPERNTVIMRRPIVAYDLVQRGVLLQVNAGSVVGKFGKAVQKTAYDMLNCQAVHFVASDCHSARSRRMTLSAAHRLIAKKWGKEMARRLFNTNPKSAVDGKEIDIPPLLEKKKRRIFGSNGFGKSNC